MLMYRSFEIDDNNDNDNNGPNGCNLFHKLWHKVIGEHFQIDSAKLLMVIVFSNFCLGSYDTLYESFFPQEVSNHISATTLADYVN